MVHFPHFNVPALYKGKYVVTVHDMTMHRQGKVASKLPLPVYFLKRLPYKFIFRKAIQNSKKIIVPSKSVKRDLMDYFGVEKEKVCVTYEGVDEGISPGNENLYNKYGLKGEKYFLYVGNAYPHKNLERVIEAIKYLNEKRKLRIFFAVASSRDFFIDRLEKEVKKLKAQKYVKFLGFVPDDGLSVLYRKSVGYIFPSLAEGFGLPGIEAIKAGTLLLASDIRVFREVYKDNAHYFNPYDFSSMSKTIEAAMKIKSKERSRLISKSQEFIKKYSWEKMAKQTRKIYSDALRSA
jgi:glycosyltransferase involved in cell wall biosynthesis